MEYLIDTKVALWCLAAPQRLSTAARALLEDTEERIGFSSVSVVEFELKYERLLGDYEGLAADFARQLLAQGFAAVAFTAGDATGLAAIKPNRDPFDRMLSAQAITRGMTLVTADRQLLDYAPLLTLW